MLRKIYRELVLIRKELQTIRSSKEFLSEMFVVRRPYSNQYEILSRRDIKIPYENESLLSILTEMKTL